MLMVYDRPPFAIASLAKTGINKPKDLEGKVLGAPAPDGAYAQWKAFVKENGIDASKVKIENIGFPVREPMLADGKVDAITGFSFSIVLQSACARASAAKDIVVMLMADHGLVLYGNAIMVNPDFAKANPEGRRRLRARDTQGRHRHRQESGRGDQVGDEAQRDRRRRRSNWRG